jgi:hypothetical protein
VHLSVRVGGVLTISGAGIAPHKHRPGRWPSRPGQHPDTPPAHPKPGLPAGRNRPSPAWVRGLAHNGTVLGVSEPSAAALPPGTVRMWGSQPASRPALYELILVTRGFGSELALQPFQLGSHSVAPLTSATAVTVARKWKFMLSNLPLLVMRQAICYTPTHSHQRTNHRRDTYSQICLRHRAVNVTQRAYSCLAPCNKPGRCRADLLVSLLRISFLYLDWAASVRGSVSGTPASSGRGRPMPLSLF